MSASTVSDYINKRVSVTLRDGRHWVGTLKSADIHMNLILENCTERIYSADDAPEEDNLGLMMVRGVNVMAIGLIDTLKEATEVDIEKLRCASAPAE